MAWLLPLMALAELEGGATAAAPAPGPDDAALTCEQIGAALGPYAQQTMAAFGGVMKVGEEVERRRRERQAQAGAHRAAGAAAAMASTIPGAGTAVSQAYLAGMYAQAQAYAAQDAPLRAQLAEEAAKAQAAPVMQDARMHRLVALAQEKNCH